MAILVFTGTRGPCARLRVPILHWENCDYIYHKIYQPHHNIRRALRTQSSCDAKSAQVHASDSDKASPISKTG